MPLTVTLADYGAGNLHSIKKALENSGARVVTAGIMDAVSDAECIVFPGVGAFDKAMERIGPYKEDIGRALIGGTPALGICIGMHIMFGGSQEGDSKGIGFMEGSVKRLNAERVPHMGWNSVYSEDALFGGTVSDRFYFAHSYYAEPSESVTAGVTEYENIGVPALLKKNNTYGCQFHPEKSSLSGLRFIRNFIEFAEGCL